MDKNGQQQAEQQKRREYRTVDPHVVNGVLPGDELREQRQQKAGDRGGEGIDHRSNGVYVRTLVCIGRQDVYDVRVGIEHEHVEELEPDVVKQNGHAFPQHGHAVIRHIGKADGKDDGRDRHGKNIGTEFPLAVTGIVNDLGPKRRKREAGKHAQDINDIQFARRDADGVADEGIADA